MTIFDRIASKIKSTNESLGSAHKAWQDESLDRRADNLDTKTRELAAREANLSSQIKELRSTKRSKAWKKVGTIFLLIICSTMAFLIGFGLGSNNNTSSTVAVSSNSTKPQKKSIVVQETERPSLTVETKYDKCVENGIAYFKEIGSYPNLKSYPQEGRSADSVAHERCERSLLAFPSTDSSN